MIIYNVIILYIVYKCIVLLCMFILYITFCRTEGLAMEGFEAFLLYSFIHSLCVYVHMWMLLCVCMCLHGIPCHETHVEDQDQLLRVSSLLPQCEFLGFISGYQV